ncbi:MAG: hypothetical protein KIT84_32200 [Labilithrix sp.]|nr:hypothetical protein [Labilithrix sp.]MCW5815735.1 hypothetical protein [Labilithrix sp.]
MSRSSAVSYTPDLGDHVLVPGCALLPGVGRVIAFHAGRPVVESVACPNITITVASTTRVVRERCREHADCLSCEELAIDCARWTRERLSARRRVSRA